MKAILLAGAIVLAGFATAQGMTAENGWWKTAFTASLPDTHRAGWTATVHFGAENHADMQIVAEPALEDVIPGFFQL